MRPLTGEWIAKAEDDFAVASREFARLETPAYNTVCFHSQQAAEKLVKERRSIIGSVGDACAFAEWRLSI